HISRWIALCVCVCVCVFACVALRLFVHAHTTHTPHTHHTYPHTVYVSFAAPTIFSVSGCPWNIRKSVITGFLAFYNSPSPPLPPAPRPVIYSPTHTPLTCAIPSMCKHTHTQRRVGCARAGCKRTTPLRASRPRASMPNPERPRRGVVGSGVEWRVEWR